MLSTPTGRPGWDPFAEIQRMQNAVNRPFVDVEGRTTRPAFPPLNLWLGESSAVVAGSHICDTHGCKWLIR